MTDPIPYLPPGASAFEAAVLTGLATVGANVGMVNCGLFFNGNATLVTETLVAGTGLWAGDCSGGGVLGQIAISDCNGNYARVGTELVTVGTCSISTASVAWSGVFQWVPTNPPNDAREACKVHVCDFVIAGTVVVGPGL